MAPILYGAFMERGSRVIKERDINIVDRLPKSDKADTALLKKVCEGDLSAFEQIYYRWNKQIYGFMLKTTRSVSDSEEITQEVFVRLWNMRENIDPAKNIQALIFTIARRIAVDMYRRRSGRLDVALSHEPQEGLSSDESPQEILEERETRLLLDIAIESMPERQREVFTLYYYNNLSPKEIAQKLGMSYDNVRKQIYNGKRQLREIVTIIVAFISGINF